VVQGDIDPSHVLSLIERYFGTDVATTTAAFMEYDRRKLA